MSYRWFSSKLYFGDVSGAVPIHRNAVLVSAELPRGKTTYSIALGADLVGGATLGAQSYVIGPGWIASISMAHQFLDGSGNKPFLLLQGALSAGGSTVREDAPNGLRSSLVTIDIKGGLTLGKTFFNVLSPYASIRLFGGPVFWSALKEPGTDAYHYQPALGLVISPTPRIAIFGEGAFAGERAITAGASLGF